MDKQNKKTLLIYSLLVLVFLTGLFYLTIHYMPVITALIKKPEAFRRLLLAYGYGSVLVFIFFQIMQVVVAAIPGEFVQVAGGYVFGTALGTLYSMVGILLGALIAFSIARFIGYPIVKLVVSPRHMERFSFLANNKKSEVAMFLLFLIPGIPKDALVYIAGLTPTDPLRFFTIFVLARLPGLLGSAYIGANLEAKHYTVVIIVTIISVILFAAGFLVKDKIFKKM